jgi:chromosome segregation ATPase
VNIYSFIFTVLQALNTTLAAKQTVLDSNKQLQKQMQATIDGLTLTVQANNQTIQELLERQEQYQATVDGKTNTEGANNQTVEQLHEKLEQCQATVDGQRKTMEAIKPAVPTPCGQQKDVSTCKVEAITTSKWAEIPPAINIAIFRPNNVGL